MIIVEQNLQEMFTTVKEAFRSNVSKLLKHERYQPDLLKKY